MGQVHRQKIASLIRMAGGRGGFDRLGWGEDSGG
jgi:hypothetical protein